MPAKEILMPTEAINDQIKNYGQNEYTSHRNTTDFGVNLISDLFDCKLRLAVVKPVDKVSGQ